ncbi:hypothetical protein MNV49_006079 [Pseudohyphozyma bogoriensis]|nr:hypothetical protein MNV49_006079 [Pseudohyphozyma bogoriensis]
MTVGSLTLGPRRVSCWTKDEGLVNGVLEEVLGPDKPVDQYPIIPCPYLQQQHDERFPVPPPPSELGEIADASIALPFPLPPTDTASLSSTLAPSDPFPPSQAPIQPSTSTALSVSSSSSGVASINVQDDVDLEYTREAQKLADYFNQDGIGGITAMDFGFTYEPSLFPMHVLEGDSTLSSYTNLSDDKFRMTKDKYSWAFLEPTWHVPPLPTLSGYAETAVTNYLEDVPVVHPATGTNLNTMDLHLGLALSVAGGVMVADDDSGGGGEKVAAAALNAGLAVGEEEEELVTPAKREEAARFTGSLLMEKRIHLLKGFKRLTVWNERFSALQSMLLYQLLGLFHKDDHQREIAYNFNRSMVWMYNKLGIPDKIKNVVLPEINENLALDEKELHKVWKIWIERETWIRVVASVYLCDLQTTCYGTPASLPLIPLTSLGIDLPAPDALWNATNPMSWLELYLSPSTAKPIALLDAVQALLEEDDPPLWSSKGIILVELKRLNPFPLLVLTRVMGYLDVAKEMEIQDAKGQGGLGALFGRGAKRADSDAVRTMEADLRRIRKGRNRLMTTTPGGVIRGSGDKWYEEGLAPAIQKSTTAWEERKRLAIHTGKNSITFGWYLDTLRSVKARWKILVVDQHTHKMLTSVLSTYDILEEGVQQVDIITNQRSPQHHLAAIYILLPTSQNVELILRDHNPNPAPPAPSRSSKKNAPPPPASEPPKYASAHLHFIEGIDDNLVGRLTAGLGKNYLQALTELYVNFHALEPRTFSLKSPRSFFTMYAPPERSPKESVAAWEDEIGWMSRALVNALVTLGEYPLIRYYNPPSSFHAPLGPAVTAGEHIGKRLAERVQRDIDAHARDDSEFPPTPDPPRPRGVLFITDRSMDIYAPLLHEFTYQAMCNDLLDIEDGTKYKYTFRNASGAMEDREATLTDDDNVWNEVRHMHMKDALDKLVADFRAYAGEHSGKFGSEGGTSLNDMRDMLASLPQLREAKDKLSLHLDMAEKCMGLFESKKLPLSASVEQCCATGVTPEGKTPKTLVEEMVPLLDDRSVSSSDKLRIIALYIMHRDGVPEGDKKRLYQHARLALHEMDSIDNLRYLGINVGKDSGKKRKPLFKQREEQDAYDISRFQPAVKYMLEEHFAGRLDQSIFPYVRDAPVAASKDSRNAAPAPTASLRSMRADWATKGRKVVNEPRQRVLVFVAGGATYSEVRSVYKVSEALNKDVFLGTTHVITPEAFVKDLSNLDRGGGAGLASHGHTPGVSYEVAKKGRPAMPPQESSQSSMDRRYASPPQQQRPPQPHQQHQQHAPRQQAPPPQQYRQQAPPMDSRGYPSQSQYVQGQGGPRPQAQGPPPPRPYSSASQVSQQTYHSTSSSASRQPMPMTAPPMQNGTEEKKKKKKLFGF